MKPTLSASLATLALVALSIMSLAGEGALASSHNPLSPRLNTNPHLARLTRRSPLPNHSGPVAEAPAPAAAEGGGEATPVEEKPKEEMAAPSEGGMGGGGGGGGGGGAYDQCVQQCMASNGMTPPAAGGGGGSGEKGGPASPPPADDGSYKPTGNDGSYKPGPGEGGSGGGAEAPPPAAGGEAAPPAASGAPPPPEAGGNGTAPAAAAGGNATGEALTPAPGQVVVAPKMGDLRMVPFNIQTNPGGAQEIEFVWGAGPHTVTQSSALTICNRTKESGAFDTGMQLKGTKMTIPVKAGAPTWYYCTVKDHCLKGMFGVINAVMTEDNSKSFGGKMADWGKQDKKNQDLIDATVKITVNSDDRIKNWGSKMDASAFPDWALPYAMENTLMTRQYYAAQPSLLLASTNSTNSTSSSPLGGNSTSTSDSTTSGNGTATGAVPTADPSAQALGSGVEGRRTMSAVVTAVLAAVVVVVAQRV
ncbi:hypothetical protein JCM8097_000679 [Rhodosporidiobolus ruineniae]